MKRFLLFACAVAAMVSCAKTEVIDINVENPGLISFSTYVGATKADVTSANIIDGSVGVYALKTGETAFYDSGNSYASNIIIPNTKLTATSNKYNDDDNDGATDADSDTYYTAVSGQWSSSTSYYWPVDGTAYDFYAYYPFVGYSDTAAIGATADGGTDGLVTGTSSTVWKIEETAETQLDFLAGIVTNKNYESSPVMLDLDHLLSKVDFRIGVCSENEATALEVTIHSISIDGIEDVHSGLDLNGATSGDAPLLLNAATYTYLGGYTYSGTHSTYTSLESDANITMTDPVTSDSKADISENLIYSSGSADANVISRGWTLSDAQVVDGITGSNTDNDKITYADIDAADGTTAFKLLPQTLAQTATADNYLAQTVTINYSVTQNGYDIVGNSSLYYKYTLVLWNSEAAATTTGLTAGSDAITSSLTAETTSPLSAFSATTPTVTYDSGNSLGVGEYYVYAGSGDDGAITYAQLKALIAKLEDTVGVAGEGAAAGVNGYSIVYTVDETSENTVITTDNTVTFDLYTTEITAWKPGYSYIYTIVFKGADNGLGGGTSGGGTIVDLGAVLVEFDVMVNDWSTPDIEDPLVTEASTED